MSVRVVAAPFVLTGPQAPAVADGAVALDGDVVADAGSRSEIEARFGKAEHVEAVLLPALVNAHLHLELSHLAGRVPGGEGLAAWIVALLAARARIEPSEAALSHAVAALLSAGVAAVGDVTNTLASLRHLGSQRIAGTLYHEVYGYSAARADEALQAAAETRTRAGAPPPGLRVVPSPHAVYSTHPSTLARLLSGGPASVHVAEDPGEREFCRSASGPFAELVLRLGLSPGELRPVARSAVAAVVPHLHSHSLVVHAVDVDDQDLADLRRSGATVVLCPRSNLHIGGRLPDLPRLVRAGLPLAVGTDSLASTPSLSPLAELAALHRAFPAVAPALLLSLAWNGAAVGAPSVGQLASGFAPGLLAAPLCGERPGDPFAWLLEVHGTEERSFVWLSRHRPEVEA